MRGVLVDDDEAVARLRDHVGLVHLRARGAERRGEIGGRGGRRGGAARAAGAIPAKALCAGSAKASRGAGADGEPRQSQLASGRPAGARKAASVAGAAGSSPRDAARFPAHA